MGLKKGIYEQVVNKEVEDDISSLTGLKATTKKRWIRILLLL